MAAERTYQKNPCAHWEWRWNKSQTDLIEKERFEAHIQAWMEEYCSDWGFQLEQGAGGLVHWQGHFRLVAKKRDPWTLMPWATLPNFMKPTCNNTLKLLEAGIGKYYTEKRDTRIAGPWIHDPTACDWPLYDCWDINGKATPLQRTIMRLVNEQNTREMLFVWGDMGCVGKSTLGFFMLCTIPNCIKLPASMETSEDMMQWVYRYSKVGKENRATIILDIPRTTGEQAWGKYLKALEDLKNGYVYDKRYSAKAKIIYPPKILITANAMPPGGLTEDRFVELPVDHFKDQIQPFAPPIRKRILTLDP